MSAILSDPHPPTPDARNARFPENTAGYWNQAVESRQFAALLATKVRCIAPLLVLSFTFIISMSVLAGYGKGFMAHKLVGAFNVGYLMILLTYALCWGVSIIYVLTANSRFDSQSADAIAALDARRPT